MHQRESFTDAITRRVSNLGNSVLSDEVIAELWALLDIAREQGARALDEAMEELGLVYLGLRTKAVCAQLEDLVGRYAIHHNIRGARDEVIELNHEINSVAHASFKQCMGERILKSAPRRDTPPPAGTIKLSAVAPPRRVFR